MGTLIVALILLIVVLLGIFSVYGPTQYGSIGRLIALIAAVLLFLLAIGVHL